MFQSIIFCTVLYSLLITRTLSLQSIVVKVKGDCKQLASDIAQEHGYRYVRQIFDGYCEIEEDPSSVNHIRHRRAVEQNIDPADLLRNHPHVQWAETQVGKVRNKREYKFHDPEWNNMWYLMRHSQNGNLPDLNVTGAWQMGYTGRGRVVTFLDDGLEFDHPDLQENYDHEASTDINGNDSDPSPRYDPTDENKHGTRCAGEVSAKADNGICGVGIAYHARVGGVRMLDGEVTDSVEARSISHRPDHVEIYSASWGPDDNGVVVDGPGILATKAFENGALNGRGGKGSIFVWASGNGGRSGDSCACDGYINSIYTVAVSSVTEAGRKPWFLEECSATLTTAYSSGEFGEHEIISTDLHHGCTSHHTGTSAAAPLAAAIYALVLEANPDLTWRDIMHITVLGSRPYAIPSNTPLVQNAAGFNVSSKYGFGLMDAGLMTWYASIWRNVPPMSTCETVINQPERNIPSGSSEVFRVNLTECQETVDIKRTVNYIEQVQIFITLTTGDRGSTEIYLYSPSKTETQLLPKRANDHSDQGFVNWPFLTVQLWGEPPYGQWALEVRNKGVQSAVLKSWRLVVHGTKDYPVSLRSSPDGHISNCHSECKPDEPCGQTDTSCTACRHYKQMVADGKFKCVGICPEGSYASATDGVCLPCHSKCGSCRNASAFSCIGCKLGFYLIPDTTTCSEVCPEKYFTDRKLRKCVHCKADCASCETNSYVCTSCSDDYALKGTDCVKAPRACNTSDYFDFSANECRWCDSQCSTCSGPNSYQCTSCDLKSKYPYLQYHTCVSSCSPGFYPSQSSSQCLPCYDTCLNCTSSNETSCLSCKLGYVYLPDSHRCEKYTGKPYYIDKHTGEQHPCHSSCTQCKGPNPTDCIACNLVTEVLLSDGHCVHDCPDGFYINESRTVEIETNICMPCTIGCKGCTKERQCVKCDETKGYHLDGNECIPTCPPKTFLSGTKCEPCVHPCLTCTGLISCLDCRDNLYLLEDRCVDRCPNGYYLSERKCMPCHPMCGTCKGPLEDECQTCAEGFVFDNVKKKCVSVCPNGNFFAKDTKQCTMCTHNCLECFDPGSYCRQCAYPMSLTTTNECSPCCTSNETTEECCQCPDIWNGYCIHPLALQPTRSSPWWLISPFEKIRTKFEDFDSSRQKIILIVLIVILFSSGLCLVVLSICNLKDFRKRNQRSYDNVEYMPLDSIMNGNSDDEDTNLTQR
ncbi:unnamed protein product [Adineta ricciae]|uniref:P/Homo B domain-containing protein n=1 Tax=Adineta ricciae TaxID=249248 RepID=A0A814LK49_ADIRI|nr:unnamed protein product [Adineta ricciae]CAF1066874.1 unnamed protein product [Adineta ricciae]